MGAHCYEIMHGLTEPPSFCPHSKLLADSKPHSDEIFEERLNAIIEVTVSPLRDKTGALSGSVHVARDITQRKQIEYALMASEKRYRELVERASDVLYQTDANGLFTLCNPATSRITGYSEEELLGKHYLELAHPDYKKAVERFYGSQFAKKIRETDYEFAILTKDGQTVWLTQRVQLLMEGEDVVGFQSICRDITELKKAQIALQDSEQRYRQLVERAADIIYQIDVNGFFTVCNPAATRITGYSQEELIGKHYLELVHPEYKQPAERFYGLQFVKKIPETYYEFAAVSKQGETVWFAQRVQSLLEGEQIVGFQAICRDITQLKKARIALEESEQRYRQLVELSPDGIYVRVDDKCVFANRAMAGMLGQDNPEAIIGKRVMDFYHPDCHEAAKQRVKKLLEIDYLPPEEMIIIRSDGATADVEVVAAALIYQGQRAYQVVVRDITDRKRAEEALRKSEEQYRMLVETMGETVVSIDENGMVRFVNNRFCEISGYSRDEIIGRSVWDFAGQADLQVIQEQMELRRQGLGGSYETVLTTKYGEEKHAIVSSEPVFDADGAFRGSFMVITDITERKLMEERLRGSLQEKEVLLKEIHHRVKNNLQIISSLLQLQSFHLQDKSSAGVLEDLESRIRAIAAVHEKLYQSESLMKIDVNEYIQDLAEHLFYSYGPSTGGIGLIVDIKDISCGLDTAVPMGLIVSELVSNSLKHGFPDGRRGSVTISLNLVPGEEFELTVSDNGVGMARDLGDVGSETLGLSLVRSLADQLHADIELDRTQGTRYRFRFREVEKPRR